MSKFNFVFVCVIDRFDNVYFIIREREYLVLLKFFFLNNEMKIKVM